MNLPPPPPDIEKKVASRQFTISQISLLLSNMVPVFGILFFGWNTYIVLMVYFVETFIAGIFAAAKIALAQKDYNPIPVATEVSLFDAEADDAVNFIPKPTLVMKFLGWHILVTLIVSAFCLFIFEPKLSDWWPYLPTLIYPAIGFTISFAISFKKNYLDKQEFLRASAQDIYRSQLLRFILIFGTPVLAVFAINGLSRIFAHYGFIDLANTLQSHFVYSKTTGIILILIITTIDYYRHIREHKGLANIDI